MTPRSRRDHRALVAPRLLAMAFCLAPRAARAADDIRLWPAIVLTAPIGQQLQIRADALVETTGAGRWTGLNLGRVVLLRQMNNRVALGGGYTLVHGVTGARGHYVERRGVQELDLRLMGDGARLLVTSRTRLEERDRPAHRGVALRLRHQTRLELPLAGTARAVLRNEYFHNLNDTAWSGPAGPSFALTFVGVRAPITRTLSIEPGYMNRISFGPARGRIDHIGALTVGVRF